MIWNTIELNKFNIYIQKLNNVDFKDDAFHSVALNMFSIMRKNGLPLTEDAVTYINEMSQLLSSSPYLSVSAEQVVAILPSLADKEITFLQERASFFSIPNIIKIIQENLENNANNLQGTPPFDPQKLTSLSTAIDKNLEENVSKRIARRLPQHSYCTSEEKLFLSAFTLISLDGELLDFIQEQRLVDIDPNNSYILQCLKNNEEHSYDTIGNLNSKIIKQITSEFISFTSFVSFPKFVFYYYMKTHNDFVEEFQKDGDKPTSPRKIGINERIKAVCANKSNDWYYINLKSHLKWQINHEFPDYKNKINNSLSKTSLSSFSDTSDGDYNDIEEEKQKSNTINGVSRDPSSDTLGDSECDKMVSSFLSTTSLPKGITKKVTFGELSDYSKIHSSTQLSKHKEVKPKHKEEKRNRKFFSKKTNLPTQKKNH